MIPSYRPYSLEREKNNPNYELFLKTAKKEIAIKKSEEIVENIYDVFYFNGREFHEYNQIDTNIPKVMEIMKYVPIYTRTIICAGKMVSGSEELKINATVKESIKLIEQNNSYYKTLRTVKENKEIDSITKYMILYSLLAEICGKQKELDDPKGKDKGQQGKIERFLLILGYDQPRKNYKHKSETIITNIRNKIGHTSKEKIDLESLQKETSENLDFLFFVLKQAVTRYKL